MINVSTNKKLDIILPNTNRALREVLKSATQQELEAITQNKDLKSILNSLLKESSNNSTSDKALLQLLKNNPTLKELGNTSVTIKDLLHSLKTDNNKLPIEIRLKKFLIDIKQLNESVLKSKIKDSGVFLESKLKNVQNPQVELKSILKSLQLIVEKSPIYPIMSLSKDIKALLSSDIIKNTSNNFLTLTTSDDKKSLNELSKGIEKILSTIQSHIKQDSSKEINLIFNKLTSLKTTQALSSNSNIKDIISNDLKSILLKTSDELINSTHPNKIEIQKHVDKLLLQIDYYQLISHLSNSSSLYLPFSWDTLEKGNIKLKKAKEDKFYCDIDLKLKEYGELNLRMVLYEENQLNIQIHSENNNFKNIIKENISQLRSALIKLHITPREIRILDSKNKNPISSYENSLENIDIGFEVKV